MDANLSVKEMFSKEERLKIDMAAIRTNAMGINFQKEEEDELKREAEETCRLISNPDVIKTIISNL